MSSKMAGEASGADPGSGGGAVNGLLGRVPRPLWWALLDLFVLTGFVMAQPLLDVAGKAPDFFLPIAAAGDTVTLQPARLLD